MITWAIIPARNGSKRLPDKNIKKFLKKPLIFYSINFAKKLKFIDNIFVSTDSMNYKNIIEKKYDIKIPFLRSKIAANDKSMEEDILFDILKQCKKNKLKLPTDVLWLRPTMPLRCLSSFNKAFKIYKKQKKSLCMIVEQDSRLFRIKKNFIIPVNKDFTKKSMIRYQDTKPYYKIFYGEFFKFPKQFNREFLTKKKKYYILPDECKYDIDTKLDLKYLEILSKDLKFKKFIHN
jgi:CMP-N,N'-diacetyllegionaminic acid synthase